MNIGYMFLGIFGAALMAFASIASDDPFLIFFFVGNGFVIIVIFEALKYLNGKK